MELTMEIKVEFDFDGFEDAIWKQMREDIEQRVAATRCSEHGESAKVVWDSSKPRPTGDNMNFQIHACCEDLANRARDAVPDDEDD